MHDEMKRTYTNVYMYILTLVFNFEVNNFKKFVFMQFNLFRLLFFNHVTSHEISTQYFCFVKYITQYSVLNNSGPYMFRINLIVILRENRIS